MSAPARNLPVIVTQHDVRPSPPSRPLKPAESSLFLSDVFLYVKENRWMCVCRDTLQVSYHGFPEELVLGVVFAENEPRVTFEGPGRLNLQHGLVVLQTSL